MDMKAADGPLPGQTGGSHFLAGFVDHSESYGPRVIAKFARMLPPVSTAVDLGAGGGRDLGIIKSIHPGVRTIAIEAGQEYAESMRGKFDEVHVSDIERDKLPFADGSVDLIMANQVLEHTKEVFWIFHEVTRSLKVGGHFLFGVPNVASFHNRLLLLAGRHPTQHKMVSAHVRPFSRPDTELFLQSCFPGGYELVAFAGSQFYPFPAPVARLLAGTFPGAAFSIFFLIRKTRAYHDEFARYPARAQLETNFWTGGSDWGGQY